MTRPTETLLPRSNPETPDRIPDLRSDLPEWHLRAACRGMDSDLFFPSRGQGQTIAAAAKQVCAGCQVITECRDAAVANNEPYGIWGGTSEPDRVEIRMGRAG